MMTNKEQLEKEGLLITEFSDDWFERETNDFEVDEIEKDIKNATINSKGIWHDIFQKVIPINTFLGKLIGNESELTRIANLYFSETEFLEFEVAQMIIYNLKRLDDYEEYDLYSEDLDNIEELADYINTGRSEYKVANAKNHNAKNHNAEKDIAEDLMPDIKRLEEKYKSKDSKIFFLTNQEDNLIKLEPYFREIHFLMLTNEPFMNYISREKGGIKIDALEKLIYKLNDTEKDLQYIWEKVTNLNVDILLAELFGKLYAHRTEKELKEDLSKDEEIKRFILNVRNMPNLFTRLLFLRNIIDFITQNPIYWKKANIKELNQFLRIRNILYKDLMQEVMKKAIIYRRNALSGKRTKWIDELEKEYPIQRLYLWCVSMNIRLYYKTEKDGQEIYLFCGVDDVNSKCMDKKIIQPEGKNKWLDLERRYREENIKFKYIDEGVEEFISRDMARKLEKDLIKKLEKDSARKLKEEMQKAYYGIRLEYFKKAFVLQSIKEQMEDQKDNIVNNLMTEMKIDWKISILEKTPEIDSDLIFVDTESEFKKTEAKRKINIKDFLKQVIESWFVSPYQSIMIEKFPERDNKRVYQCLEILMKL